MSLIPSTTMVITTLNNHLNFFTLENQKTSSFSHFYSPETGIYRSHYSSIHLPSDPFLDVVSFIFSFHHNGVSALIDSSSGFSLPYSNLLPLVKSMAFGLQKMGISKGDVVLILLPNSIFYPIIFLSVLYLGAVVTTMTPHSSFSEIKKRIDDCNVCLAFSIPEKVENFHAWGISVIEVPENVDLNPKNPMGMKFSSFFELISFSGDDFSFRKPKIEQQDTAAILYSSGTTGVSKGVVLTHRNFIATVELFVRFEASTYEFLSSSNVYLAVLPMFHIYGLSLFVMGLLSLGSSIVVMRKFDIKEMVKAIDRYNVSHFPVVPPILAALVKTANKFGHRFHSLKQVSSGAAPLRRKAIEEFLQTFPHVDLIQGYGMTESTAVATRGFNTKETRKYSSVGLLAPSVEAKVVDLVNGSFLPPGRCGELLLRGPAMMKGYLNNTEATVSTIDHEAWLHTGDIVYFDTEGYLYVIDRLKEMIKYKGFQIAPADLEAVLITHPEVLEVAVTAAVDQECGEIPVAFVVKKPGSSLSHNDVQDFVAQQVAPYKKIRKVIFTEAIPKSAAGKILRLELKKQLTSKL